MAVCQTCPTNQQPPGPQATPHPRGGTGTALTVHGRQKRQVEDLPHQHLQEANLQGKNENSTQALVRSDPRGPLEALPCGRKAQSCSGRIWELP